MKPDYLPFKIFLSFPYNLQINHIPGNKHRDKNNQIINPCQCISFCTNISNPYLLQQRQLFFSSHLFIIILDL